MAKTKWEVDAACALVLGRQLGTGRKLFDTYVLGVRRRHRPKGWALPGGGRDRGEHPKTAAIRELREETGLIANPRTTYHLYTGPAADPDNRSYDIVATYLVTEAEGKPEPQPPPHDEGKIAWVLPPLIFNGPYGPYNRVVWTYLKEMSDAGKGPFGPRRSR
jgi:8-oxo-dGTP pyrophosphatase MutT (NUDIX family)